MAFPTTIDSFSTKNTGDVIPASDINNPQTAIVALETKVGVDSSAVVTTLDYKVTNTASSDPGHKHTLSSLSDFNVSGSATGNIIQYNGTKYVNVAAASLALKFGGTGADGALSISSGTTTINCANAAVVIKNYTSISITGSGTLAFSNPNTTGTTVILKSQGAVTLTSSSAPMIAMNAMGAAGGAAVSSTGGGNNGSTSKSFSAFNMSFGVGGNPSNGAAAAGGTISLTYQATNPSLLIGKYPNVFTGGGGGGGAVTTNGGTSTSGVGGRGGGGLIIECGGAFNFTTTSGISVAGAVGTAASGSGSATGGGGGGGGGGFCGIFYNTLTANTGTITVSAGTGGNFFDGGATQYSTGGGGGAGSVAGTASATGTTTAGGAGGVGISLVASNTEFA